MPEPSIDPAPADFAKHIERARALRLRHQHYPEQAAKRLALRQWQAQRLARTYADLLADDRYRPAAEFFLSDLYGTQDTSARDNSIARLYPAMQKLLPAAALHSLGLAFELDALSEELDLELLDVLVTELGFPSTLNEKTYAEAYRRCKNYELRKRQIQLLVQVGADLGLVASKPTIYATLRAMRTPAKLAGFGELQDFLERGFNAFRHMQEPREFLTTIERRETLILDRIYRNHSDPFKNEPTLAA